MNILILNGSPRARGNTSTLLQAVEEGIRTHLPEASIESVPVTKLTIKACLNCDACKKNDGHCVQKDDTRAIMEKVQQAHVLILGSPVYWWGLSAQLKLVIDKFYSCAAALKAQDKKVGLITVGAESLDDPEYELIEKQLACICDFLNWKLCFSEKAAAHAAGEIAQNQEKMQAAAQLWQKLC